MPRRGAPVLEVPKAPIEPNVMPSGTPEGDLFDWPVPGTLTAPKFLDVLKHPVAEASTKSIVCADRHPAHDAKAGEPW
jgi:hypothetical protein